MPPLIGPPFLTCGRHIGSFASEALLFGFGEPFVPYVISQIKTVARSSQHFGKLLPIPQFSYCYYHYCVIISKLIHHFFILFLVIVFIWSCNFQVVSRNWCPFETQIFSKINNLALLCTRKLIFLILLIYHIYLFQNPKLWVFLILSHKY